MNPALIVANMPTNKKRKRDRDDFVRAASAAIDGTDDGLKLVFAAGITWKVIDELNRAGPTEIFRGTQNDCINFLKGIAWGAKAGRDAMAAMF